jgi:pimeloyl-ACP methyl ester carboxylesterase
MTGQDDEFELLAEEAAAFDIPLTAAPSVERRTVTVPDPVWPGAGRVSALVWGERSPEVALLHGAGLNAHTWDATAMALDRPLVALDLPGHGDSDWRADADYRPDAIAPAATAALAELAPDPVVLVGQSLGGLVGAVVAAARGARVRAFVLIDLTPGFRIDGANQVRDFLDGVTDFADRDEIVDRALAFGFGPDRAAVARGVFHNTRVREDGRVVFKHHLANRAAADGPPPFSTDFSPLWEPLTSLTIPVVLVRGERGFLSDELVAEFLGRVPGSTAVTLPTGHNVQEEAPVALAEVIRGLLPG